jgi:hypothetical protein
LGQHRQKLGKHCGKNCLLTPSARSGKVWQDGGAMNEREKQFSFTRAALSTGGRAKSKFLSVSISWVNFRELFAMDRSCLLGF